jgi:hypothetical protein
MAALRNAERLPDDMAEEGSQEATELERSTQSLTIGENDAAGTMSKVLSEEAVADIAGERSILLRKAALPL